MILYKTKDSNIIRVDSGSDEEPSNVVYFETIEDYETALTDNQFDADTLVVIKSGDNIDASGSLGITVDSTLSSTSENPVQSKIIYNKFNELTTMINNLNTAMGTQMSFTLNGTDLIIKTL